MDRSMRSSTSSATTPRTGSRTTAAAAPPRAAPQRPHLQDESAQEYASSKGYVSSRPSSAGGQPMSAQTKEFVPAARRADERDEPQGGSRRGSGASSSATGPAATSSASARGGHTAPRREQGRDPREIARGLLEEHSSTSRSPSRRDRRTGAQDRDRDRNRGERRDDRRRQDERRDHDRRGGDSRRPSTEKGRYRSGQ